MKTFCIQGEGSRSVQSITNYGSLVMIKPHLSTSALLVVLSMLCSQALAWPTQVVHNDTPQCDTLFIPTDVHEIGDFMVFPSDESLFATSLGQQSPGPCVQTDDLNTPDEIVEIRNLSGIDWLEVWYVANPETTITNFDGEANDILFAPLQEAFRIDSLISDPTGSHHPLIFESMTPDGIWEAGESWRFILQDYSNSLGIGPEMIDSIGVGNASGSAIGITTSSGSIIAIAVPEPATCVFLAMSFTAILLRRT